MTDSTASLMMVTYNRLDLTKETLDIIMRNTKYPFKLIVVDNGSSDDTPDFLAKYCQDNKGEGCFIDYQIVLNEENKGIAIGRNQCLSMADTEWLVTMDNDIWVPPEWLGNCIKILQANKSYGSIGVNMEGRTYPLTYVDDVKFQCKPRGNLGTACMVFHKNLHKMLGYFNYQDYGKYGEEDADWGMRVRVLGLKLGYIYENGKHLGEGERDTGSYRDFKTESHRNNLSTFNKNCTLYARGQKPLFIPFKDETD